MQTNKLPVYRTNKLGELSDTFYPNEMYIHLKVGETRKEPPRTQSDEVALLNHQTGEWEVVPDYRGFKHYTLSGEEIIITMPNVTPPENAITIAPESPYHTTWEPNEGFWAFDKERCVRDLLEQIESHKRMALGGGIKIGDVVWDTDYMAELMLTQIWLRIVEMENNNEVFVEDNFYPNSDLRMTIDANVHAIWRKANEHRKREIFAWRAASRELVSQADHSETLLGLFDTLTYKCCDYTSEGEPIING